MIDSAKDRDGNTLYVGSEVRIVGEPDLSMLPKSDELRSRDVFAYILGSYRRVVAFDARGLVELEFRIMKGRLKGHHFVWIEPSLLKLRAARSRRTLG